MEYISTRGKAQPTDSANSIIQGIASDGGLFVPAEFPNLISRSSTRYLKGLIICLRLRSSADICHLTKAAD